MRIGIVGSGMIVNDCLEAIKDLKNVECTTICVRERSFEKGKELAQKYGIEEVYTNYEAFLKDQRNEVIYIGIINSEHFSYAKQALEANRHVILEKPFTMISKEAKELAKLAKEKELFLWEAITTIYFPNFLYLKNQIAQLGEVKLIQCNFSQYSSRYDKYLQGEIAPAFDVEAGGGALRDLNIYNIHFVTALFGEPEEVQYIANIGHNGIDTSGVLMMKYPNFIAQCVAAKDSQSPHFAIVQGTKGYIKVNGQASICQEIEVCTKDGTKVINQNTFPHRMQHEFDAFATMYEKKDYETCYQNLEHTVRVMEVL